MEWLDRLKAEIAKDGRSYAELARQSGGGRNHVQQLVKYGKVPRGNKLALLFRALNVSATYIFTGARMTREAEELLQRFSSLTPDQQKSILDLLRSLSPGDESR